MVTAKEITLGNQRYRVDNNNNWSALMFGSYIDTPSKGLYWRWMPIPESKVPKEVIKQSK